MLQMPFFFPSLKKNLNPRRPIKAEMRASLWLGRNFFLGQWKIRVTGPNGIMVAQAFCDIFFLWKKDIRYQYINSFQINCFFINNIKIHSFTSLTEVGALQGNLGRYRCAAEIAKTPQCICCYQMKPEFTCYSLFDNLDTIG